MFDEYNSYSVPIPANVKTRMEIINGVGIKEMIQTAIAGIIGLIIAYIVYLIKEVFLLSFGIFAGISVLAFLITMKDKYNQSIAMWIANMIRFYQNQRLFIFVRKEEDLQ